MDLFVDAIDSKLQPSEKYTKLVTNSKSRKISGSKPSVQNKDVAQKKKAAKNSLKKPKSSHHTKADTPVAEPEKKQNKEDETPVPFLNCLIESCTDLVRETNQFCAKEYRNVLLSDQNSDKLKEINRRCQSSIDTIKNMIMKVATDHVFDKKTNLLDVLFDEIESGFKRHDKRVYTKLVSLEAKEVESDKELTNNLDEDEVLGTESTVTDPNLDAFVSKKALKRALCNSYESILDTHSIDIDLRNYNLPPRPQDNWKDSIDNFSVATHSNYEKFNQIEPQIKYTKKCKQVRLFEKKFVPRIYPKRDLLSRFDDNVETQVHVYSQELNSLSWSEERLDSTHQGYNILGGVWNLLEVTEPCDLKDPVYKMVETEKQFDEMIEEIKKGSIVSIDVEHHDLNTYRGYVSLIQVSTPNENYIVDPFNIFTYVNNLNKVTTDPRILKIFHGSMNDVVWLQRDFGVYIVNMFDTREAAIALNMVSQSLASLLYKYFEIKLNKKYQLSDWSKRPLDQDMLNYACSDSCYLIPLYVTLKNEILKKKDGKTKMIRVMNICRSICLRQFADRGVELSLKFKNILKRNKMKLGSLNFVTYNFVLNLVSFRNYAARKLDVSERMILKDFQISSIVKRIVSH